MAEDVAIDFAQARKLLRMELGDDALHIDDADGKIYVRYESEVPISQMIDAQLGLLHGYGELPTWMVTVDDPESVPALCVLANDLNIAVVRDLGLEASFHVIGHALHLSLVRQLASVEGLAEEAQAQAEEIDAVISALARQHPAQAAGSQSAVDRGMLA
ncbi:MAG: hypothetical protein AAF713_02810 [Pseudomonadota bacterium]